MNLAEWMELLDMQNTYKATYQEEAARIRKSSEATPTIDPQQKALRDAQKTGQHSRRIE